MWTLSIRLPTWDPRTRKPSTYVHRRPADRAVAALLPLAGDPAVGRLGRVELLPRTLDVRPLQTLCGGYAESTRVPGLKTNPQTSLENPPVDPTGPRPQPWQFHFPVLGGEGALWAEQHCAHALHASAQLQLD